MFWYVLQIIVCSFVLFAMIFQTCYSIYIRYKFWCWLQSHLQQDLTILKLVSWSNSNAIVLDWEVHISGQSNQTQCCHHCNISSKGAVLPCTNLRGFPPCYILWHNMSIVKDLMWSEPCNISAGSKSCFFADYFFAFNKTYNVVKSCCESDYCKWDIVALARKYFISLCC